MSELYRHELSTHTKLKKKLDFFFIHPTDSQIVDSFKVKQHINVPLTA